MSEKATKSNGGATSVPFPVPCTASPSLNLQIEGTKPRAPSTPCITHPTPECASPNSNTTSPSKPPVHSSSTPLPSSTKRPNAELAENPLSPSKKALGAAQHAVTPPRRENVAAPSTVTPSNTMASMSLATPTNSAAARVSAAASKAQVSLNFETPQGLALSLPARYWYIVFIDLPLSLPN
jgi:hypothetical protein